MINFLKRRIAKLVLNCPDLMSTAVATTPPVYDTLLATNSTLFRTVLATVAEGNVTSEWGLWTDYDVTAIGSAGSFVCSSNSSVRLVVYIANPTKAYIKQIQITGTVQAGTSGLTSTIYTSPDNIDYTQIYTVVGSAMNYTLPVATNSEFVMVQFVYDGTTVTGGITKISARTVSNVEVTQLPIQGIVPIMTYSRKKQFGSKLEFKPDMFPYPNAFNVFEYPHNVDSNNARPGIYFGTQQIECTDSPEFQTTGDGGASQYRAFRVPLVLCVNATSYEDAIDSRDIFRQALQRTFYRNRMCKHWWSLEMNNSPQLISDTCIASTSGGIKTVDVYEATCLIPIIVHYRHRRDGSPNLA